MKKMLLLSALSLSLVACDASQEEVAETNTEADVEQVETEEVEEVEEATEEVEEVAEEEVPREHRNALKSAESYVKSGMGFSESGLSGQLEFESFPADAIEYALANVSVDWNEQALISAENYENTGMGFSDQGLRDQLAFEGFTAEQIDYAMNNL